VSERAAGLRRVGLTLAVYVAVAALVWWILPSFQRLLLLPTLFPKVVTGALFLGVPVVSVLAWRYPSVGGGGTRE